MTWSVNQATRPLSPSSPVSCLARLSRLTKSLAPCTQTANRPNPASVYLIPRRVSSAWNNSRASTRSRLTGGARTLAPPGHRDYPASPPGQSSIDLTMCIRSTTNSVNSSSRRFVFTGRSILAKTSCSFNACDPARGCLPFRRTSAVVSEDLLNHVRGVRGVLVVTRFEGADQDVHCLPDRPAAPAHPGRRIDRQPLLEDFCALAGKERPGDRRVTRRIAN